MKRSGFAYWATALAFTAALFGSSPAPAQQGTNTNGMAVNSRPADLAVSNVSARRALSAGTTQNLFLNNSGSVDAYCALGDSSVVATTSSAIIVAAGVSLTVQIQGNTNIACITSASTTTMRFMQGNGSTFLRGGGSGTVTNVSVVTANGVSGSVANPTTQPEITLTLGAITPTTVAIGAGSAITSSGPGGALTALAYTAPGTGVATALGNTAGGAGGFALVGTTPPTGAAGGSLKGTYPNPGLADVNTIATSLAVGGATIGTDALGVTGTATFSGKVTASLLATSTACSATAPSLIVLSSATTTGVGCQASGNVSIIAGATERMRIATSAASVADVLLPGTVATGGTGTTQFPQILVQPTGTSAVTSWSTAGTILGMNVVSGFGGNFLDFHAAGAASVFSVSSAGALTSSSSVQGTTFVNAASGQYNWAGRGVLTSPAAGSTQLGSGDVDTNASIVAQTLRSQGTLAGGTSDQAGKDWTFIASPGKGTGIGGSFLFQTTGAGSTGTVVNTPATRLQLAYNAASLSDALFPGTLFTGGSATTTFPQILVQPTGTSAVTSWSTSGTHIGVNAVSGFAGNFIDFHVAGGGSQFFVTSVGSLTANGSIITNATLQASTTGNIQWLSRGIMTSPAAGSVQLGAIDVDTNASIVAQTLRTQGALTGGTTNQAGKDFTILVSPGKGTGAGGNFIVQTAPAGSTGSTPNAGVTALTIDSTSKATFAGAATVTGLFNTLANTTLGNDRLFIAGAAVQTYNTGVFGWSSTSSSSGSVDTGLSRDAAGVIDVGTGAQGSTAGSMKMTNLTASGANILFTALANSATTSAVCYNTGTGALTYNSTVGTCTVSTIAAKDLIAPLTKQDGHRIVMGMQAWRYDLKKNMPTYIDGEQVGLVAQYADKVDPRFVAKDPDGRITGVRYEQYTAAITAAIQYQDDEIRKLKADNDNLRREVKRASSR